jgi:hypothetical protein
MMMMMMIIVIIMIKKHHLLLDATVSSSVNQTVNLDLLTIATLGQYRQSINYLSF